MDGKQGWSTNSPEHLDSRTYHSRQIDHRKYIWIRLCSMALCRTCQIRNRSRSWHDCLGYSLFNRWVTGTSRSTHIVDNRKPRFRWSYRTMMIRSCREMRTTQISGSLSWSWEWFMSRWARAGQRPNPNTWGNLGRLMSEGSQTFSSWSLCQFRPNIWTLLFLPTRRRLWIPPIMIA